jgi:hypothetical protein
MQSRDGNTQVSKQYLTYPLTTPIDYSGDYSGTFSQYSLVDKNYVDSLVQSTVTKRLISGSADWTGVGMTFSVSSLSYTFTGPILTSPATYITLPNGDPSDDRIDAIIVYDSGTVSSVQGTPAPSPVTPQIPDDAVLIQYVIIPTGSTTPNISYENIYLENLEWNTNYTVTTSGTWSALVGTVSFQETSQAYQGLYSTYISSDSRTYASYQKPLGTMSLSQYVLLTMKIKLPASITTARNITVRCYYNSTAYGNTLILSNYGFSQTSTAWQTISIPTAAFGTVPTMNRILVRMTGVANGVQVGYYLDAIQLQTGISPPVASTSIGVFKNGGVIGTRSRLNFIEGNNVSLTVSDNTTFDRVDITVNGSTQSGATAMGDPGQFQITDGSGVFVPIGVIESISTGNLVLNSYELYNGGARNVILGRGAGATNSGNTNTL